MLRRKKLRRKSLSKKTLYARAEKNAWEACREAIKRRDKVCQVHGAECKNAILVVDHFLSRTHKRIYFDERNLTLVCRTANWEKFRNRGDTAFRISKVVENKWGKEAIEDLGFQARIPKKYSIQELEEITRNFNRHQRIQYER